MVTRILIIFSLCLLGALSQNSYVASNIQWSNNGLTATVTYPGNPTQPVIANLLLNVTFETPQRIRFKLTDSTTARWEVPDIVIPPSAPVTIKQAQYTIKVNSSPFGLTITRNSNSQVIFNLDPTQVFQYNNQDIILLNNLNYPTNFYGIGERVTNFPILPGVYTLFSRDAAGPYDDGQPPGSNMYSNQPFYLALDSEGNAHGGFFLNSNAMDVFITATNIKFRTIGGVIDFFVFVGPEPEDVITQYHQLVGNPVLIPYWGLGWNHCRWGYNNLTALQWAYNGYLSNNIPIDIMWTDINYMINYQDFTLDPTRYPYDEFGDFIDSLHETGRRFVPITDAAIAQTNYFAYNTGLAQNVYIGSANHPGALVGSVWPGNAVYIDWFHPNATGYWHSMMSQLREVMEFDGFWCDMNEPSNFCNGECGYPEHYNNLPYTPGQTDLNTKTIDLAGTHYGGLIEYNVHSLYGMHMAINSASFFTDVLNTRPFVITRSSFPGLGRSASKWLGDNFSQFNWMAWSIPGVFNFQMFGIPLIGADICGFNDDTTAELCSRWFQLGTLYPFARQHNTEQAISQEPWMMGPTLLETATWAIRVRYSLINYYYYLMFSVSLNGGAVFKPAFFEYPGDANLQDLHSSDNFMVGSALIVHPVLTQGATNVTAYFPSDVWYNWYDGLQITLPYNRTLVLNAPLRGLVNIHMRGGYIIPRADDSPVAMTIQDLRYSTITLVIALDAEGTATGGLVLDDGLSVNTISSGNYTMMTYMYKQVSNTQGILSFTSANHNYVKPAGEYPGVSNVVIYGCQSQISAVTVNGVSVMDNQQFDETGNVCAAEIVGVHPDDITQLNFSF